MGPFGHAMMEVKIFTFRCVLWSFHGRMEEVLEHVRREPKDDRRIAS